MLGGICPTDKASGKDKKIGIKFVGIDVDFIRHASNHPSVFIDTTEDRLEIGFGLHDEFDRSHRDYGPYLLLSSVSRRA